MGEAETMRMWGVNPKLLCNQHLLGEHVEMHMFAGNINKGRSINGYVEGGLVQVDMLKKRHDCLALEMQLRGIQHTSNLPPFDYRGANGSIDCIENLRVLAERCQKCAERIGGFL